MSVRAWITRKLHPGLVPVMTVLALLLGGGAIALGTALQAHAADADTYSWGGATTLSAPADDYGYSTCPSNDMGCKDYPKLTYTFQGVSYGEADPWGYYLRNCTSFVAEKISQEFDGRSITGWGSAYNWATAAQKENYSLDTTPQVGDIAVWGTEVGDGYGHVAYVASVDANGVATFDEYNVHETGAYTNNFTSLNHPATPSAPDWYIHMGTPKDAAGGSSGSSGTIPAGGNLHNYYVGSGGWTAFDASSIAGVNMIGTPAVDPNGGGDYARGLNNDLYQFYVGNGSWTAFDISTATGVKIYGDPVVGPGSILARDINGHLRQFYVANGSWTAFDISTASGGVSIQADPGYSAANGIWAIDTSGNLRQFYVANSAWVAYNVSSAVGGAPVVGTPAVNGGVYARGTNNDLCQFYVLNGRWVITDVTLATGGVHIQGDPADDPSGGLWGVDINNHLRQFYVAGGSWVAADISSATNQNVVGTPAIDPNGSGIYARSSDGHLFQFYVSSSSWTGFDMTNATGAPTITGTPVINAGGLWAI